MTDSHTVMCMRNRRSGSTLREPDLNKCTSSIAPDDPEHLLTLSALISTVYLTLLFTTKANALLNAALLLEQTVMFSLICYSKSLSWNKKKEAQLSILTTKLFNTILQGLYTLGLHPNMW